MLIHLVDRVHQAGISEAQVMLHRVVPIIFNSIGHDIIQCGVHNVNLVRTFDFFIEFCVTHNMKHSHLTLLLVFLRHHSWSHMINILEPFKVGAGDAPAVDQHVRGTYDAFGYEDLLGCKRRRPIGSLEDRLALNIIRILYIDAFLCGCRHQVINLLFEVLKWVLSFNLITIAVADKAAVLHEIVLRVLHINATRFVYSCVSFHDVGDLRAIFMQELCGPKSYVTETLNGKCLIFDSKL